MKKEIISIIVPCYNSYSKMGHLLACLENQKIKDFELIIIDDKSTDDTFHMLNKYMQNTKIRMKLYENEKNSGPGISRNIGISKSNSEYVMFVDSDDYLSDDFFEVIKQYLNDKPDCLLFDYNYVGLNNKITSKSIFYFQPYQMKSKDYIVFTRGATLGKIFKRKIIVDNNVVFLNQKRNEDMAFTKYAISLCNTVKHINIPLYYYVQYQDSLMHTPVLTSSVNSIKTFKYLEDNFSTTLKDELQAIYIHEVIYLSLTIDVELLTKKEWCKKVVTYEQKYPDYLKNKYFKYFPLYIKLVVWLIHMKCYSMVKSSKKIKRIIKKIKK